MNTMKFSFLLALSLVVTSVFSVSAQMRQDYVWETAGNRYMDPASFFSLHGYVESVYGAHSRDWSRSDPAQVGAPGQVLVSNTDNSSFQYDGALFIGSEPSPGTQLMLEMHIVSDPSGTGAAGPGGLTLVFTEATASWDIHERWLTLSGGLFWAPFGTLNHDWLGAQNLFGLMPRASSVVPDHWNERGFRINGATEAGSDWGANYVASYGNGVSRFGVNGQSSSDQNQDKSIIARVGVFPGFGRQLEIGYSIAAGKLRNSLDPAQAVTAVERYPSRFEAHGLDVTYMYDRFKARSFMGYSREDLGADNVGGINPADPTRIGFMTEFSYDIPITKKGFRLKKWTPKARFDWFDREVLAAGGRALQHVPAAVYSLGVSLHANEHFLMSTEYHIQDELGRTELANNRFVFRIIGRF
jgi:hypothetical protein